MANLLVVIIGIAGCKRASSGIGPGNLAPEVSGISDSGEKISLKDFRGRFVLLNFWATWCTPCVLEMPALESLQAKFDRNELQVLAVSVDDSPDAIREFKNRYQLSFPLVSDKSGKSGEGYKLTGVPETVLVDPQGKITLFQDPENGDATTKVVGPRRWDSPALIESIRGLIGAPR